MKPPTIMNHYQTIVETCEKEKFVKIIQTFKDYHRFLKSQDNTEEREMWLTISDMWLEMLEEISNRRFFENLVKPEVIVSFSYSKNITEDFEAKDIQWKNLYRLVNSSFNYSPSRFTNGYRKKDNWKAGNNCIVLDIDKDWTIEEAISFLMDYNFVALITTTKSHQKEKDTAPACDRFRVFLPVQKPFSGTPEEFSFMMGEIFKFFKNKPDTAARDVSRFYYGNPTGNHIYIEGENLLNLDLFPRRVQRQNTTYQAKEKNTDKYQAITRWFVSEATQGNRNNTLFKAYNFFKEEGMQDLYTILSHINSQLSVPLPDHEIKQISRIK